VFQESTRLGAILTIPRFFTGGFERVKGVTARKIERLTISADRPIQYHVDGEPAEAGTTLEGRVLPSALRIAVR
jgi:diacylglycerol kinase family enzyme